MSRKALLSKWWLLALLGFVACSDPAPSDGVEDRDATDGLPSLGDVAVPDVGPDAEPADTLPPLPDGRELEIEGQTSRLVFFGSTVDLTVFFHSVNNQPIPNQRVAFAMLDDTNSDRSSTGMEGTILRSTGARTGEDGRATVQIAAGTRETHFKIKASVTDDTTAPVYWNVTVARQGAGVLEARVSYCPKGVLSCPEGQTAGRYSFSEDLATAEVLLFENVNCPTLLSEPAALPPANDSLVIRPFNEVANVASFSDLENGARLSVLALGQNVGGNTLALGCVPAEVVGGQLSIVEINLHDMPLDMKGTYTVLNKFDLTDLLRSTENDTLATVADVLDILRLIGCDARSGDSCDGRAQALIDLFCSDIFGASDSVCDAISPFRGLIERMLDEVLWEQAPQVMQVFQIISDVLAVVGELTVVGQIEFTSSTPDENGHLPQASDNRWQKFRFVWRNNCPAGVDCRREFPLGNIDDQRRPIAGSFDAQVQGMDLIIGAHSLTFRYGLIILGVAEQWIIPAILGVPGPVSFEDMLTQVLPCEAINDFFGDPQSGICEDVLVAALSEVIIGQIERLDFNPQQFQLAGTATLVDEDGNLQVDRLDNGVWDGVLTFGETQLMFRGCFVACRGTEECPNADCRIPAIPGQD